MSTPIRDRGDPQEANSQFLKQFPNQREQLRGASWINDEGGVHLSKGLSQVQANIIAEHIREHLNTEGFKGAGKGVECKKKDDQFFIYIDRRLISPNFEQDTHGKIAEKIMRPMKEEETKVRAEESEPSKEVTDAIQKLFIRKTDSATNKEFETYGQQAPNISKLLHNMHKAFGVEVKLQEDGTYKVYSIFMMRDPDPKKEGMVAGRAEIGTLTEADMQRIIKYTNK